MSTQSVAVQYFDADLQPLVSALEREAQQALWIVHYLEKAAARDFLEHLILGWALYVVLFFQDEWFRILVRKWLISSIGYILWGKVLIILNQFDHFSAEEEQSEAKPQCLGHSELPGLCQVEPWLVMAR